MVQPVTHVSIIEIKKKSESIGKYYPKNGRSNAMV